jgi:hypothetical protein
LDVGKRGKVEAVTKILDDDDDDQKALEIILMKDDHI